MANKAYAFMMMGPDYGPQHTASFTAGGMDTLIVTVNSLEQARTVVPQLVERGVGALELCGAFGPEAARELIALTGGKLSIGYVTHFPEQDPLFSAFFGD